MEKNIKLEDRRNFLKKTGSYIAIGLLVPTVSSILNSCEKDQVLPPPAGLIKVVITNYPALSNEGGVSAVQVTDESGNPLKLIVERVRLTPNGANDSGFLVYKAVCPHAGGIIDPPSQPGGNMVCELHQLNFSLVEADKGKVNADPKGIGKKTPLTMYDNSFSSPNLTINLGKVIN